MLPVSLNCRSDCRFAFLTRILRNVCGILTAYMCCLSSLCVVCPMLPVSLNCPFWFFVHFSVTYITWCTWYTDRLYNHKSYFCVQCLYTYVQYSLHSKMILESLLLLLLSYFILIFCFYRECYSKNASSWNKVNIYVFITVKHTYIFTFVKKYHTVGTIPNINIVERENWYSEHSYTWLLTFMAWYRYFNKYWGVQLIL